MTPLVDAAEIAELLYGDRRRASRVYALAREGVLPPGAVVRLGRTVRFNRDAVAEFVRAGGRALPGGWRREAREGVGVH